ALPGDPTGYTVVDLGHKSMFAEIDHLSSLLRSTAAIYENEASSHHTYARHDYSFPNTILAADVIVSVGKLKVHRKAGVTLSLKNMVGATNEKRWLPHHRKGFPAHNGDMSPDDAPPDRKVKELIRDGISSHRFG